MLQQRRLDYMFSYWVLIAYVLFYFQVLSYNPKHILFLGVLFNGVQLCVFIWHQITPFQIFLFLMINICIKIIPIYTIRKTSVSTKDDMFYLGLFFVYIIWLYINDIDIHEICKIYFQYRDPILFK